MLYFLFFRVLRVLVRVFGTLPSTTFTSLPAMSDPPLLQGSEHLDLGA